MVVYGKFFFVANAGDPLDGNASFSNAVNCPDVWQPPVDVLEVDGGIVVYMDLPGVDIDSLEVTIEGKYLIVRGVRAGLGAGQSPRFIQMEICRGIFGKIIPLPMPVVEQHCTAKLVNGVLEIFLPVGKSVGYETTAVKIETGK